MSLRICILETDILRPELIERYEGSGRMFQQLFAKQPIAAEFVIYNVVEGRYPADDERFDAYLVTGSKADSFGPDPWIQTLKTFLLDRYERADIPKAETYRQAYAELPVARSGYPSFERARQVVDRLLAPTSS